MNNPICFIAMPFGTKTSAGQHIDFDAVWKSIIGPAIEAAGMQPLRADEEQDGGIIHKPMFERLLLCDFAVCDLTFANANVFYELGIRHAARPATTVLIMANSVRLPFDVALLRTLPYALDERGQPASPDADVAALSERLIETKKDRPDDSPLYQLLDGVEPLQVDSDKTDVFRKQVAYNEEIKSNLARARRSGKQAVDDIRASLDPLDGVESGVAVDLMLSYRAIKDWAGMVDLIEALPKPLRQTVMLQEQLGFALNRDKRGEEAERVLRNLIETRGPSSESLGILGRVYKDRWETALKAGQGFEAKAHLRKAIDTYRQGFETDWRDHFPGINAVTLMELRDPPDPEREVLLPVVRYSVDRRIKGGKPDYWDWATLLELEVLASSIDAAHTALGEALAVVREPFEPETTCRNLRLIREAREGRDEEAAWIQEIESQLQVRMAALAPQSNGG